MAALIAIGIFILAIFVLNTIELRTSVLAR
mgnify:CR=1 FL=1